MLRKKLLWCFAAFGGLLVTAAGVAPEQAVSNLSKWAEVFGFLKVSEWLATDSTDMWGVIIGLVTALGSITMIFMQKESLKSGESNKRFESLAPKTVEQETREKSEVLEFIAHSNLLKISAKNLRNTTSGLTRYALYYNWNNNNNYLFDHIEGFAIKIFEYDIDEDGNPELIIEYHCGAHTMVMNVYKINGYGSPPALIPGASIGSDWPDIRWHANNSDEGTVLFAKQRNWSKTPTKDYIEDKYLLRNGLCQKIA